MKKLIVFDMDGTIANLYGVKNWLLMLERENTKPYEVAEPLCSIREINKVLKELKKIGYTVCVTTWLSKDGSNAYNEKVAQIKKQWLQKYNFEYDYLNCVPYGTPKQAVTGCYEYETQIIFDDDKNVRDMWDLGPAYDPQEISIIKILKRLLKE